MVSEVPANQRQHLTVLAGGVHTVAYTGTGRGSDGERTGQYAKSLTSPLPRHWPASSLDKITP
ncbi:hypothetical protein GCM10010319_52480 [Streptomyces blastmyceticus]|uniref:Uncharacterized protein n=1 Tax=Streptomyces blastmyceticus TaxID=68180 RepID=A0ABP3HDN1_9ACTN